MNSTFQLLQPAPPPFVLPGTLGHASELSIPSLTELHTLRDDLLSMQDNLNQRAQDAESNLLAFETIYRKAKARGKVKGKGDRDKERGADLEVVGAHERESDAHRARDKDRMTVKIKREYSGTPDADDMGISSASRPLANGNRKPNPNAVKALHAASIPASSPASSHSKLQKVKHKRKRTEESDDDKDSNTSELMPPPSQKPRPSPHPGSQHPSASSLPKLKVSNQHKPPLSATGSLSSFHGGTSGAGLASVPLGVASDFTLPPRPPLPSMTTGAASGGFTYTPTPTSPYDVEEDFTDRKAPPNQTPTHTFWKEVESWMKPVGEEDVAWLEFDADDVEPFLIPALGKHYTEIWEEEDRLAAASAAAAAQNWPRGYSLDRTYDEPPPSSTFTPVSGAPDSAMDTQQSISTKQKGKEKDVNGLFAVVPTWDPRTITETDLSREDKGLGAVTERIMSALLLDDPTSTKARDDDTTSPLTLAMPKLSISTSRSSAPPANVGDLEGRIRGELRALGLLNDDDANLSTAMDDDITCALRQCQSLLQEQCTTNLGRKTRLLGIARDRLAYQDYQNVLEGLEKSITTAYGKMIKSRAPKKKKDKDKNGGGGDDAGNGGQLGGKVVLEPSEALMEKVALRERWVGQLGQAMRDWERREPGRLTGLPKSSIYKGLGAYAVPADGVGNGGLASDSS